jgi:hypothetical protein
MRNAKSSHYRIACGIIGFLFLLPALLAGKERFQIELYGGISHINPKDFNLLSKAEEEYNKIFFIQRLYYDSGYFLNDFPEVKSTLPLGVRLKYWVSEVLAFSLGVEGFSQKKEDVLEGTLSYTTSVYEGHTRKYDPFRLGLRAISVMGGAHYRIPFGTYTDLEVGAAAGWTKAEFDFCSAWSYTAEYQDSLDHFTATDSATLEGEGAGNGFTAQGMLRLNRMLGKRFGLFVETVYTFCRLKSIEGTGREYRPNIPTETTWEAPWGIKKEEIHTPWIDTSVSVPTNYWGEWTAGQRERDFVLNLTGLRLVLGICFRF